MRLCTYQLNICAPVSLRCLTPATIAGTPSDHYASAWLLHVGAGQLLCPACDVCFRLRGWVVTMCAVAAFSSAPTLGRRLGKYPLH
jgi:hypothetical protein